VLDEYPAGVQARGYRTNKAQLMHTDDADIAGLLCLQQGASGGGSPHRRDGTTAPCR
jgi:hypothetical protein